MKPDIKCKPYRDGILHNFYQQSELLSDGLNYANYKFFVSLFFC